MTEGLPFIDSVTPDSTDITPGQTVTITISGNWPTPSWSHSRIVIKQEGTTVVVKYMGEKQPGIALQVLKPFQDRVMVTIDRPGTWILIVEGRSGSHKINLVSKK